MKIQKKRLLITLALMFTAGVFSGMLFKCLQIAINREIMQSLIIVLAISFSGIGFTGFQIDKKSKYFKLQTSFLIASLIFLFSIIFSLLYILGGNTVLTSFFRNSSIILSISGLSYFLAILIISIFWIDYMP